MPELFRTFTDIDLTFQPLVSGTRAVGEAIIVDGQVTGYTVIQSGAGYTRIPKVYVYGDGSGALATAVLHKTGKYVERIDVGIKEYVLEDPLDPESSVPVYGYGEGYTTAEVVIEWPNTADLPVKTNDNAIKNAVKNLILTRHYERHFHSEIGSTVNDLLFELMTPGLLAVLNQEIRDVITNFEPRVELLDVNTVFNYDRNAVDITILFRIINTTRPITLQFTLERTR